MRILFMGDIVGRVGRDTMGRELPGLRKALAIDLAIVNAENASHGFGLAPDMAAALFTAGADVITLGNHAWDRKEIIPYIAQTPRLIRPLNYPPETPGHGFVLVDVAGGRKALVLQAMGRLYMDPLDCPFRGTADVLARYRLGHSVTAIVADIHAEATSEKWPTRISSTARCRWSSAPTRTAPARTPRCCRAVRRFSRTRGCAGITTA